MRHVIHARDPVNLPITSVNNSVGGRLTTRTDIEPWSHYFPPNLLYQQVRRSFATASNGPHQHPQHISRFFAVRHTCGKIQKKNGFCRVCDKIKKFIPGAFAHFWGPLHPSTPILIFGSGGFAPCCGKAHGKLLTETLLTFCVLALYRSLLRLSYGKTRCSALLVKFSGSHRQLTTETELQQLK